MKQVKPVKKANAKLEQFFMVKKKHEDKSFSFNRDLLDPEIKIHGINRRDDSSEDWSNKAKPKKGTKSRSRSRRKSWSVTR